MSSDKKWTVVGISGVTCGGKTTFSAALQTVFPDAIVISQDSYFLPPDDPRHTRLPQLNHINWEISTALDMEKMVSDIKEIMTRPTDAQLLIIEGYLIFTDPFISSLCDLKYFFILSSDICRARRATRTNEPPDPTWASAWYDVSGYFEQVLWPEYERHFQIALCINSDMKLVDGARTTQSIVDQVEVVVKREWENKKNIVFAK